MARKKEALFFGEVKSLTSKNELLQMRRGLRQILHSHYLAAEENPGSGIIPVLVIPSQPSDQWIAICEEAGVALVWPNTLKNY